MNANPNENTDLYFALRGGGNNFGIVTTFDLNTFSQGKLWGGATVYPLTANVSIYNAYYWFNTNAAVDPKGALIVVRIRRVQALFSFLSAVPPPLGPSSV